MGCWKIHVLTGTGIAMADWEAARATVRVLAARLGELPNLVLDLDTARGPRVGTL
jgi:hypothetical protein